MKDVEEFKHESYGLVSFTRGSYGGAGPQLFGSMVRTSNMITLSIKKGVMCRHLGREWFHEDGMVAEVELSPNQFAELLTTMNVGSGVPCTIRGLADGGAWKRMEAPPNYSVQEQFQKDIEREAAASVADVAEAERYIEAMCDGSEKFNKGNLRKALALVNTARRKIDDSMPFTVASHRKAMGKATTEAKSVVAAFHEHAVSSLGMRVLEELNETSVVAPVLIADAAAPGREGFKVGDHVYGEIDGCDGTFDLMEIGDPAPGKRAETHRVREIEWVKIPADDVEGIGQSEMPRVTLEEV